MFNVQVFDSYLPEDNDFVDRAIAADSDGFNYSLKDRTLELRLYNHNKGNGLLCEHPIKFYGAKLTQIDDGAMLFECTNGLHIWMI